MQLRGKPVGDLIKRLNPIIRSNDSTHEYDNFIVNLFAFTCHILTVSRTIREHLKLILLHKNRLIL
jgi:hypothetical protein